MSGVLEAATPGEDVDNGTDGKAGFDPEVGMLTIFEDALINQFLNHFWVIKYFNK